MARSGRVLAVVVFLAGCLDPSLERLRDYNEDGLALFQSGHYAAAVANWQHDRQLRPAISCRRS